MTVIGFLLKDHFGIRVLFTVCMTTWAVRAVSKIESHFHIRQSEPPISINFGRQTPFQQF